MDQLIHHGKCMYIYTHLRNQTHPKYTRVDAVLWYRNQKKAHTMTPENTFKGVDPLYKKYLTPFYKSISRRPDGQFNGAPVNIFSMNPTAAMQTAYSMNNWSPYENTRALQKRINDRRLKRLEVLHRMQAPTRWGGAIPAVDPRVDNSYIKNLYNRFNRDSKAWNSPWTLLFQNSAQAIRHPNDSRQSFSYVASPYTPKVVTPVQGLPDDLGVVSENRRNLPVSNRSWLSYNSNPSTFYHELFGHLMSAPYIEQRAAGNKYLGDLKQLGGKNLYGSSTFAERLGRDSQLKTWAWNRHKSVISTPQEMVSLLQRKGYAAPGSSGYRQIKPLDGALINNYHSGVNSFLEEYNATRGLTKPPRPQADSVRKRTLQNFEDTFGMALKTTPNRESQVV